MYLSACKYTSKYNDVKTNEKLWKLFKEVEPIDNLNSVEVKFEIGYWRKSNQIHNWFVDNCQDGKDECQSSQVSREQLKELLEICEKVLKILSEQKTHKKKITDKVWKQEHEYNLYLDTDEIKELLPTREGFFFGDTQYDEYYKNDIEHTIEIIKRCLELPIEWDFEYRASW